MSPGDIPGSAASPNASYTGGMKALARLESLIQDIVERPATLLGSRRLHPLEMAAALTRALENGALALTDRVLVPDRYTLQLSPADFTRFAPARATLEREFADYITRLASERTLTLGARTRVEIIAREGIRPGAVQVVTAFTDVKPPAASRPRPAPVASAEPTEVVGGRAAHNGGWRLDGGATLELLGPNGVVLSRERLPEASVVIGRRASSDIALDDIEVSRRHAELLYQPPSAYFLRDLESTNGTLLNGRPVQGREPLTDGDLIELGGSRLRFRQGG